MGRMTQLVGENLTVGTGRGLAGFQTAAAGSAGAIIIVRRVEISQSGTTTLQQIRGEFCTRDTAGTYTMTSATPKQQQPYGGPASGLTGNTSIIGGTARSGVASSADSGGTYTSGRPFNFPNTAGYLWKPDLSEFVMVPASTVWIVRLLADPTTTTGWTIAIDLEEF